LRRDTATIFENNTVVTVHDDFVDRFGNLNVGSAINMFIDVAGEVPGAGAYLADNIFSDLPRIFGNVDLPTGTTNRLEFHNNLVDESLLSINEWFANGQLRLEDDFLELYNPDPLPVALEGLYLTDEPNFIEGKFRIPALSFIAGGGYTPFIADSEIGAGANHLNFRLSADQELLGLYDAELRELDRLLFYPQTTDVSQGRSPDGASAFEFFDLPTLGAANLVPDSIVALGHSLRITEIMFNPPGDLGVEFIELQKVGGQTLNLDGVRLRGGVQFTFPPMTLGPNEYVAITDDISKFAARYGAKPSVAGAYEGSLSNDGEPIVLQLPDPYAVNSGPNEFLRVR
jgi:hypothetical protein